MWEVKVALAAFLPLRIGAGQFMLAQAMQQVAAGWLQQPLIVRHLETVRSGEHGLRVLAPVAEHVLRHSMVYSVATCTGQLVLGLCLCLGLLSRTSAALSLIGYLLVGLLTGSRLFDSGTVLLVLSLLSLSLVPAGRVFGLDLLLRNRLPQWLT
jgi:hypothetical protein